MKRKQERKPYKKPRAWKGKLKAVTPGRKHLTEGRKKIADSGLKVYRLPDKMRKEGRRLYLKTDEIKPYFIDKEVESILRRLLKAGLNVEKPVKSGPGFIVTMEEGKRWNLVANKFNAREKKEALRQLADLFGKMHSMGVSHYHPHKGNITWDGKRIGLIDFKFADEHSINWKAKGIEKKLSSKYFTQDYKFLTEMIASSVNTEKEYKEFFKRMLEHYPIRREAKQKLLEEITGYLKEIMAKGSKK